MVFDAIYFSYGSQEILRGVFLELKPGRICGLCGRNGTGKTTLMNIGVGLLKAYSGNIFINGRCTTTQPAVRRFVDIAYLPQKSFLPREIKVGTLLRYSGVPSALFSDGIIQPLLPQQIYTLSSGERRYLELRLVLGLERSYFLLDEPFTGSAPILVEKMMHLIQEKKDKGAGILLTDHYRRYVEQVVDDIYILSNGYCHQQTSPS